MITLQHPHYIKISDETLYETGKIFMDITKLCLVALVVTPIAQQLRVPIMASILLLVSSAFFWFLVTKMLDKYSQRKELQYITRRRKHRIRIPKNMTVDVEVEK